MNSLTQITHDALLLVLPAEEIPDLSKLTTPQRFAVRQWARDVHDEANDNDIAATAAPACLRQLLPPDHYLQRWRVGLTLPEVKGGEA
jgi:uncharacterized protein (DUF427 family)